MTAVVGVVGPGAMGLGIVASLVRAGMRVVARDIRSEANARAQAAGATIAASPAEVARAAPIVIVVVVDAAQVDDVLFGDDGIVAAGATGRIVMVASTLDPEYVRALPARCMHAGIAILDTPISGGPAKAHDGTMTIMVAGPNEARERAAPVLEAIAARRFAISDRVGDAAATKIVNNLLAGANLAAAAEALALAEALGLDVRATADVIAASSGASWIFAGSRAARARRRPSRAPPRASLRRTSASRAMSRIGHATMPSRRRRSARSTTRSRRATARTTTR